MIFTYLNVLSYTETNVTWSIIAHLQPNNWVNS